MTSTSSTLTNSESLDLNLKAFNRSRRRPCATTLRRVPVHSWGDTHAPFLVFERVSVPRRQSIQGEDEANTRVVRLIAWTRAQFVCFMNFQIF